MYETVIVVAIVLTVVILSVRSVVRTLTGRSSGCAYRRGCASCAQQGADGNGFVPLSDVGDGRPVGRAPSIGGADADRE